MLIYVNLLVLRDCNPDCMFTHYFYSTTFPKLRHSKQNAGPGNTLDVSLSP
jgi:hypothetical protein